MKRHRRNPPAEAAAIMIAPIVPYVAAGVVLYFFGGKLWDLIGAKIAGTSVAKFKESSKTVADTIFAPVTYIGDAMAEKAGYITPATQAAAIAALKAEIAAKNKTPLVYTLPFPSPQSQAEFRANIAAIDKAIATAKVK